MVIAQLVTFAMVQLKNGAFVAITAQIGAMISIAVVLLVYFFTKYPEKFKYLHGS